MGLIIGIDGDVDKNGVAVLDKDKGELELKSLTFFDLLDYLKAEKENIKVVKIEASWLVQKSNFHFAKSKGISDRISAKVGANHETGKKIIEMCQYLNLEYKLVKPFQKTWGTPSGKISAQQLKLNLSRLKINLICKHNNQDARDSALICLYG